jgi:DNA anti-recombination protein RmuC
MFVADSVLIICLIFMGAMSGVLISIVRFMLRQRVAFITALQQSAEQQINTAQQLASALSSLQRQQQQHEQKLQTMANALMRLRHEMTPNTKRTEVKADKDAAADAAASDEPPRILH